MRALASFSLPSLIPGAPARADDALKVGDRPSPRPSCVRGARSRHPQRHLQKIRARRDARRFRRRRQAAPGHDGRRDRCRGRHRARTLLFVAKGAPEARAVAAYGNDLAALSLQVRADEDWVKSSRRPQGQDRGRHHHGRLLHHLDRASNLDPPGLGPRRVQARQSRPYERPHGGPDGKGRGRHRRHHRRRGCCSRKRERSASSRTAAGIVPDFISNMLYASEPLIKDRPDTLRRFLAGWFETARFIQANKAETIRFTQPDTKMPDDIAAAIYDKEASADLLHRRAFRPRRSSKRRRSNRWSKPAPWRRCRPTRI